MVSCVVPVSGGKDSQLCLQLAVDRFGADKVVGLFCDTRFEHPKTYAHIEFLRSHFGVTIETVNNGSVDEKCLKYKRFPSALSRFCTDELKMRPARDFYRKTANERGPFEVWLGMRSAESSQRKARYLARVSADIYAPHDVFPGKYPKLLASLGVSFRLPVLDWSTSQVMRAGGASLNPLYAEGFGRVGCFPCLASGARSMAKAFGHDAFGAEQSRRVIAIASRIGKDPMSSDGSCCGLCMI